jgi:serine/threonine protein kinase/Tol biopolymer transport system component
MILKTGSILNDRYRIVSVLGQGGMGAVYRAVDERLGSPVAVKENLNLADEFARQFKREAVTLSNLRHPALPRVADYFAYPRQGQYLVMDYIEGEDLRQRIERAGSLPDRDVVLIGEAVCEALTYLHSRVPPVIHRDIKPGNIKITPDQDVFLVDFGLVKQDFGDQATTTGARAMTPGYSPPEQYGSARTDARTDIYSLAATLYAALTGSIPEDSITRAARNIALTPIQTLSPNSSKHLCAVIEKGLELNPDTRYQTAEEFRSALLESLHMTSSFSATPRITAPPPDVIDIIPAEENLDEIYSPPVTEKLPGTPKPKQSNIRPVFILAGVISLLVIGSFFIPWNELPFINQVNSISGQVTKTVTSSPRKPTAENPSSITVIATQPGDSQPDETQIAPLIADSQPTPLPTSFAGGGQIAFASNRTGNYQIWVVNPDGSGQRQITGLAEGACQPSWSPDGMKLAFISPCSGKKDIYLGSKIYISDVDGKNPQAIPVQLNSSGDFSPSWSPDSRMLAFSSLRGDSKPHIYIYTIADASLRQLTNATYGDLQPVWTPSGLQIAFVRQFPNPQVWITDLNGQLQFQYSPSGAVINIWPEWSKDGSILFYSQMSPDAIVPYLVGLSYQDRGKNLEFRIPALGTAEIGPVFKPSVSPDGQWIAYESWPDGTNHDIYIITVNGTDRHRLTIDKDWDFGPAWKPLGITSP